MREIVANEDLNNIRFAHPGFYYVRSASIGQTIGNRPGNYNFSFGMIVIRLAGGGDYVTGNVYCEQILFYNDNSMVDKTYTRRITYSNGAPNPAQNPWYKYVGTAV